MRRARGSGELLRLDHVQLAMPEDGEAEARRFYAELLGLTELPKPANLATRGGVCFAGPDIRLHLGVERDFRSARKAHPTFIVAGLDALAEKLRRHGCDVAADEPLEGFRRIYTQDPFGNRIELMEPDRPIAE